jgi:hypothetical protein
VVLLQYIEAVFAFLPLLPHTMPPAQSAAYLERLRDRLVAIRQNTKQNALSLKTKLTGSFGRKHTPAPVYGPHLHPLAITFGRQRHLFPTDSDEDDDGSMSPLRRQDSYARSDSMDPVVPPEDGEGHGQEGGDDAEEGYRGYHSLNSMKMRKAKLEEWRARCDRAAGLATVGRAGGQGLQDMLRDLHGTGDVEGNGEGDGDEDRAYEDTTRPEPQDNAEEAESSSNPYPDDFPIPTSPPEPQTDDSVDLSSNPYPDDFRIPTSSPEQLEPDQEEDEIEGPVTPSPHPSNFSIFPVDRTISPISPYDAARHQLSARSLQQSESQCSTRSEQICDEYIDRYLVDNPNHPCHNLTGEERRTFWNNLHAYRESPRKRNTPHPLRLNSARRGRDAQPEPDTEDMRYEAEESWHPAQERLLGSASLSYEGQENEHDLRQAFMESLGPEARLRAAEAESLSFDSSSSLGSEFEYEERLDEEDADIDDPEPPHPTQIQAGKKKSSAGRRLVHTLVCRPGTCTPDCPAVPVMGSVNPHTVAPPHQKFKLYRLKDTLRRNKKDKGKQRAVEPPEDEPVLADPEWDYLQSTGRDLDGRSGLPDSWRREYVEERNFSHAYYQPPQPGSWLGSGSGREGRGGAVGGESITRRSLSGPPHVDAKSSKECFSSFC